MLAPEHPFPADPVVAWWEDPDVTPWLLIDPTGAPSAYGEVWDDDDEDESELARIMVDPARRRSGLGRLLVEHLVTAAQAGGHSACCISVNPGNDAALALYRSAGFRDVDDVRAAAWNLSQQGEYRWLEHPAFPAAAQ